MRMTGKNIIFDDKKINKINFYKNKKLPKIDDIDVNKVLISKKEAYGKKSSFKYFIGYNDDDAIRPLCVKLPQMGGYVKCFDSNKKMSFKVINNKLLQKHTKIWGKVGSLMNIKFDSESVYGDNGKYIKTKIKIYEDKVNTKCLSLIMLDPVIRVRKKHYPQTLLEECESAKLRALRAHLPTCLTCLHAHVPTYLACSRALHALCAYVLTCYNYK